MFTHIVVGSNDLERSRRFYDAIFTAMGAGAGTLDAKGRFVYSKDGYRLLVTKPINGQAATFANGGTTAEDPPGVRQVGPRKAYLAYLRDPDGNKLCASCRLPD